MGAMELELGLDDRIDVAILDGAPQRVGARGECVEVLGGDHVGGAPGDLDRYLALKPEDVLDVGARELGDDVASGAGRGSPFPRPVASARPPAPA